MRKFSTESWSPRSRSLEPLSHWERGLVWRPGSRACSPLLHSSMCLCLLTQEGGVGLCALVTAIRSVPCAMVGAQGTVICSLWLLLSHSAVSDSSWPQGRQHARLPCPSPSPRSCSNSRPSSRWCHTATLSSVVPFCFLSVQASGPFPMSRLLSSGAQSTGASASASVLPMNIQGWFPLGWTGLILRSKGFLTVFSKLQFESVNSLVLSLLYGQLSYSYMTTGKTRAFTIRTFVCKVMSVFICGLGLS